MFVLLKKKTNSSYNFDSYSPHFIQAVGISSYKIDDNIQSQIENLGYIYIDNGEVVVENEERSVEETQE